MQGVRGKAALLGFLSLWLLGMVLSAHLVVKMRRGGAGREVELYSPLATRLANCTRASLLLEGRARRNPGPRHFRVQYAVAPTVLEPHDSERAAFLHLERFPDTPLVIVHDPDAPGEIASHPEAKRLGLREARVSRRLTILHNARDCVSD